MHAGAGAVRVRGERRQGQERRRRARGPGPGKRRRGMARKGVRGARSLHAAKLEAALGRGVGGVELEAARLVQHRRLLLFVHTEVRLQDLHRHVVNLVILVSGYVPHVSVSTQHAEVIFKQYTFAVPRSCPHRRTAPLLARRDWNLRHRNFPSISLSQMHRIRRGGIDICSKSVVQQIITVRVQVALSAFQDVLNALQRNRDNPNVGFVQQIHERRDATLHHPSACK
jgi:hypothetical protein